MSTLHAGQKRAFETRGRFKAVRCGRRWGKSTYATTVSCTRVIKKNHYVGFFAPDYKKLAQIYRDHQEILKPLEKRSSQTEGIIQCTGGGHVEFWTLDDENAGRSRKYHLAIIDEAAFAKDNMTAIWERAIKPTLLDYSGQALVLSNTNGDREENFFWRICNLPEYGFTQYHAPTHDNPLIPLREPGESEESHAKRRLQVFEELKRSEQPLVYQQEYLADFVNFEGATFFVEDKLLVAGKPVPIPPLMEVVFATIDTAVKDGQQHDCTAVVYWGRVPTGISSYRLVVLDWDIIQIQGALLETWLPTVYQNLNAITKRSKVLHGSIGAFIEDKQSGSILLQQALRRQWAAHPIDSKLTDLGKDGRAISVSGYVHREMVKVTEPAFTKVTELKGVTRNHFLTQVKGFRIGDKDAHKRADDLADCFMYGIAIALGDDKGF